MPCVCSMFMIFIQVSSMPGMLGNLRVSGQSNDVTAREEKHIQRDWLLSSIFVTYRHHFISQFEKTRLAFLQLSEQATEQALPPWILLRRHTKPLRMPLLPLLPNLRCVIPSILRRNQMVDTDGFVLWPCSSSPPTHGVSTGSVCFQFLRCCANHYYRHLVCISLTISPMKPSPARPRRPMHSLAAYQSRKSHSSHPS